MTTLKAAVYCKPIISHRQPWVMAFTEGLRRHGAQVDELDYHPVVVPDADVHIFWSLRADEVIDHCKATGQPFLCLDRGFTRDRMDFAAINLNGLNGRSELDVTQFSGDSSRCQKNNWTISAPKTSGGKLIIVGQVSSDKSLEGADIYEWAAHKAAELRTAGVQEEILFRPHPLEKERFKSRWKEVGVPCSDEPIEDVMANAKRFITYSSTAGCDAWMNGIDASAESPISMIYRDQGLPATIENRTRWLNKISFVQYSKDEMSSGEAWEILGSRIIGRSPQKQYTP